MPGLVVLVVLVGRRRVVVRFCMGGTKLGEKTTKFLGEEMVGDGEENDGDGGELDTPGLPADSHGAV